MPNQSTFLCRLDAAHSNRLQSRTCPVASPHQEFRVGIAGCQFYTREALEKPEEGFYDATAVQALPEKYRKRLC